MKNDLQAVGILLNIAGVGMVLSAVAPPLIYYQYAESFHHPTEDQVILIRIGYAIVLLISFGMVAAGITMYLQGALARATWNISSRTNEIAANLEKLVEIFERLTKKG